LEAPYPSLFIINFQDFDKGLKNLRKGEKLQAGFFNPEEESDNSNRKMRNISSFWSFGF